MSIAEAVAILKAGQGRRLGMSPDERRAGLEAALVMLHEAEARYAKEVETGCYKSGRPLSSEFLSKRRISLQGVRRRITICTGWLQAPPRLPSHLTPEGRELVEDYDLFPFLF